MINEFDLHMKYKQETGNSWNEYNYELSKRVPTSEYFEWLEHLSCDLIDENSKYLPNEALKKDLDSYFSLILSEG